MGRSPQHPQLSRCDQQGCVGAPLSHNPSPLTIAPCNLLFFPSAMGTSQTLPRHLQPRQVVLPLSSPNNRHNGHKHQTHFYSRQLLESCHRVFKTSLKLRDAHGAAHAQPTAVTVMVLEPSGTSEPSTACSRCSHLCERLLQVLHQCLCLQAENGMSHAQVGFATRVPTAHLLIVICISV